MLTPFEQSVQDLVLAATDVIVQAQVFQDQLDYGQESLLTELSDGFQKFLSWLKQKVLDLLHKFITFVKYLKATIFGLVSNQRSSFIQSITSSHYQVSPFEDKEIFIPYNVEEIFEHLKGFREKLPIQVTQDNGQKISRDISGWFQIWHELVLERDRSIRIMKSKCCSVCRRIVDYLNFLEVQAIALSENVSEVRYLIDKAETVTDVVSLTSKLIRGTAQLVNVSSATTYDFLMIPDTSPRTVSDLKNVVLECIKTLGYITVSISNILEPLPGIMIRIGKIYDNSGFTLHYTTTIDPGFHRHIEQIIGDSVRVDNIIVTTKEPNTWPTDDNNTIIGWCHASYGSIGARDLWINARYLLRDISPDGIERAARLMLVTIVHECTHLSDGQNYKRFDQNRSNDDQEERRAYGNEKKYVPTLSELNWAKTQIKTMISKMK